MGAGQVHLAEAIEEPDRSEPPHFFNYQAKQITARGAVGNPLVATADNGREILAWAIEDLTAEVKRAIAEEIPAERWIGVRQHV